MSTIISQDNAASVADSGARLGPEPKEMAPPCGRRLPTLPKDTEVSPVTHKEPTLSNGETARLGEEIYERDIRPDFEEAHLNEFVAIDVDTGDWALSDDLMHATASLRAVYPDAVNVWMIRVGYNAVYGIGARPSRRAP